MRLPLITLLVLSGVACRDKGTTGDSGTGSGTVDGSNQVPIALAGSDQTVPGDGVVALTGEASNDPEGTALTYYWAFDTVPTDSTLKERTAAFTTNHTTEAATSFTPDKMGTYVISLMVRDAAGLASNFDYVIITVDVPSTNPVANAGPDQATAVGSNVTLNGASSYDPGGRPLTYSWVLFPQEGSSASLSDSTSASPTLTPDKKGSYTATLIVHNGLSSSTGDSVTITATANDGVPVASAGADQLSAEDCTALNLDCSASSDPDGDPLQYFWEVQGKPAASGVTNATFFDRTSATPTFYTDQAGTYVLSCTVYDGTNWSVPDSLTVQAAERATNDPPVVNAGEGIIVDAGSAVCEPSGYVWNCDECSDQTVALGSDSAVSDSDRDPMRYVWTVESGDAIIENADRQITNVLLENLEPEEAGVCASLETKFRLTVTDCTGASASDTVTMEATCCGVEDTSSE